MGGHEMVARGHIHLNPGFFCAVLARGTGRRKAARLRPTLPAEA